MSIDRFLPRTRVAHFSMEMALRPEMHTYSGGLGVLAGDTARSWADLEAISKIGPRFSSQRMMRRDASEAYLRYPPDGFAGRGPRERSETARSWSSAREMSR
jgi:hypothetical protein